MPKVPTTKLENFFETFQKLSHEDKVKKVLAMLEYIKKLPFAELTFKFMKEKKEVSERFLETIYKTVMTSALDSIQEESAKQRLNQLKTITNIEKNIAKEKAKAESILNDL